MTESNIEPVSEVTTEQNTEITNENSTPVTDVASEAADASTPATPSVPKLKERTVLKGTLRTFTEYDGFRLRNALNAVAGLEKEGKSAEEIEAALKEQFKLEDEKLKLFQAAMTVAKQKLEHLKRVIVYHRPDNAIEGAPPVGYEEAEAKYLKSEFFYIPQPKRAPRGDRRDGKGGGRRGGGNPRGRGGRDGGGRNDRPRTADQAPLNAGTPEGAANDNTGRPPRRPRFKKPAREIPPPPAVKPPPIVLPVKSTN